MTKKTCFLLAGMLATFVGPTLVVLALKPRPPQLSRPIYDFIKDGMSRAKVEAMLGPAKSRSKDYSSFIIILEERRVSSFAKYSTTEVRGYTVYFDEADRVIGQEWGPRVPFLQELYYLDADGRRALLQGLDDRTEPIIPKT
jgi:hypothetical protein